MSRIENVIVLLFLAAVFGHTTAAHGATPSSSSAGENAASNRLQQYRVIARLFIERGSLMACLVTTKLPNCDPMNDINSTWDFAVNDNIRFFRDNNVTSDEAIDYLELGIQRAVNGLKDIKAKCEELQKLECCSKIIRESLRRANISQTLRVFIEKSFEAGYTLLRILESQPSALTQNAVGQILERHVRRLRTLSGTSLERLTTQIEITAQESQNLERTLTA